VQATTPIGRCGSAAAVVWLVPAAQRLAPLPTLTVKLQRALEGVPLRMRMLLPAEGCWNK